MDAPDLPSLMAELAYRRERVTRLRRPRVDTAPRLVRRRRRPGALLW